MLVEGGYLHSMKLMIERAADTPDPAPGRPATQPARSNATGALLQSIKRLVDRLVGF